jgi:hypothetical protein
MSGKRGPVPPKVHADEKHVSENAVPKPTVKPPLDSKPLKRGGPAPKTNSLPEKSTEELLAG